MFCEVGYAMAVQESLVATRNVGGHSRRQRCRPLRSQPVRAGDAVGISGIDIAAAQYEVSCFGCSGDIYSSARRYRVEQLMKRSEG